MSMHIEFRDIILHQSPWIRGIEIFGSFQPALFQVSKIDGNQLHLNKLAAQKPWQKIAITIAQIILFPLTLLACMAKLAWRKSKQITLVYPPVSNSPSTHALSPLTAPAPPSTSSILTRTTQVQATEPLAATTKKPCVVSDTPIVKPTAPPSVDSRAGPNSEIAPDVTVVKTPPQPTLTLALKPKPGQARAASTYHPQKLNDDQLLMKMRKLDDAQLMKLRKLDALATRLKRLGSKKKKEGVLPPSLPAGNGPLPTAATEDHSVPQFLQQRKLMKLQGLGSKKKKEGVLPPSLLAGNEPLPTVVTVVTKDPSLATLAENVDGLIAPELSSGSHEPAGVTDRLDAIHLPIAPTHEGGAHTPLLEIAESTTSSPKAVDLAVSPRVALDETQLSRADKERPESPKAPITSYTPPHSSSHSQALQTSLPPSEHHMESPGTSQGNLNLHDILLTHHIGASILPYTSGKGLLSMQDLDASHLASCVQVKPTTTLSAAHKMVKKPISQPLQIEVTLDHLPASLRHKIWQAIDNPQMLMKLITTYTPQALKASGCTLAQAQKKGVTFTVIEGLHHQTITLQFPKAKGHTLQLTSHVRAVAPTPPSHHPISPLMVEDFPVSGRLKDIFHSLEHASFLKRSQFTHLFSPSIPSMPTAGQAAGNLLALQIQPFCIERILRQLPPFQYQVDQASTVPSHVTSPTTPQTSPSKEAPLTPVHTESGAKTPSPRRALNFSMFKIKPFDIELKTPNPMQPLLSWINAMYPTAAHLPGHNLWAMLPHPDEVIKTSGYSDTR